MLRYLEFETASDFCHTITGQFPAAGARGHFRLDPEAIAPPEIDGVASLVDGRSTSPMAWRDGPGSVSNESPAVIQWPRGLYRRNRPTASGQPGGIEGSRETSGNRPERLQTAGDYHVRERDS